MKRIKMFLIVGIMAVVAASSVVVLRRVYGPVSVEQWRRELNSTPENRVAFAFQKIAALDQAGIPVLAMALGSERECVAQSAQQQLERQWERWKTLPVKERFNRHCLLIESLASEIDRFGPSARNDAAAWASRVLSLPLDDFGAEADKLLIAGDTLLRTARAESGLALSPRLIPGPGQTTSAEAGRSSSRESSSFGEGSAENLAAEMAPLPGGGLPIDLIPLPGAAVEKKKEEPYAAAPQSNQPQLLDHGGELHPIGSYNQPPRMLRLPDDVKPAPNDSDGGDSHRPSAASNRYRSMTYANSGKNAARKITEDEILKLMEDLHSEDEAKSWRAETALKQYGFSSLQIDLAGRLTDPDPEIRLELVRQLPGMQGVDAAQWLLRMCRDPEADVRLAAISFLATSADPTVLQEIEQIASSDEDSRVQRVAERIAQQRNGKR